jgi:hypothetical protein
MSPIGTAFRHLDERRVRRACCAKVQISVAGNLAYAQFTTAR